MDYRIDEQLIKQYNLENVRKRFQQLNEYSFVTEAGDDDMNQEQPPQQPPMQQGGQEGGQQMPQGEQQPPMQQDPNMANGEMPTDIPQDGEQPATDMPADDNMDMVDDLDMTADNESGDTDMDVDTLQPDDEVIDVDELSQSQETTEYKVDGVDEKLTALLQIVDKFSKALDANTNKVEELQNELERRNPTDMERINIRSQQGKPFDVSPKEYWTEKMNDPNSNYKVIFNNDVDPSKEEEEFKITRGDIQNGVNDKEILKTLDIPNLTLKDYFE